MYYIARNQFLTVILLCSFLSALTQAHQGLIYGQIQLKNGAHYEGQIRWAKKEALWEDLFAAPKYNHPSQNLFTEAEVQREPRREENFKYDFMQLWEDKSPNQNFAFRCRFGDIASLRTHEFGVMLMLKDGKYISLKYEGNVDKEEDIFIIDREVGQLQVEIKDIQFIYFCTAPENIETALGSPVYGKVLTTEGEFEGFITWDSEECLGQDLISGKQKGVKIDIKFEEISELTAHDDGSRIILKSGRNIFLNNHDDVSKRNHGILIHQLPFGKLKVQWKDFISIVFFDPPRPLSSFESFLPPKLLTGYVHTKDQRLIEGQIIYDLDEIYDIEMLNGEKSDFEYFIPFKNVDKVIPQNDKFSLIYLIDGTQFVLGGSPDVDGGNHGILVKLEDGKAEYINWDNINEINFE